MICDLSYTQSICDILHNALNKRPTIQIPVLSGLTQIDKVVRPPMITLSQVDKDYVAYWKLKQMLLYEDVTGEQYTNDIDITDPDPYTDQWYIFKVPLELYVKLPLSKPSFVTINPLEMSDNLKVIGDLPFSPPYSPKEKNTITY